MGINSSGGCGVQAKKSMVFIKSFYHKKKKNSLSREKVVSLQKAFGNNIFKEPLSLHSGQLPSVLKEAGDSCGTESTRHHLFLLSGGVGLVCLHWGQGTALNGGKAS